MKRRPMSWRAGVTVLLLSLACSAWIGCGPRHQLTQNAETFDLIATASFDSLSGANIRHLPRRSYKWRWWWARPRWTMRLIPVAGKIDSVLAHWIADSSATRVDTLIVTFVDHVPIPRFPEPEVQQDSSSAANKSAHLQARVLIQGLEASRAAQYHADSLDLVTHFEAQVLEHYWLTQALRVRMPIGRVDSLALKPNVVWIQLDHTTMPPPSFDIEPLNDAATARDIIVSEPYYRLGLSYGWVSVLDTGIRQDHVLFQGATSPFNRVGDCVDGTYDCYGGNPGDVTGGHGTASAAILAANNASSVYAPWRGVTAAKLDVFRVYRPDGADGKLVVSAALRGLQDATGFLDRVIVAEMQDNSTDAAAIPDAAEGAFRAGSTIIAANGNFGATQPSTMSFPACARLVLGVGARHILSPHPTIASQSFGTTADHRQKPDLQAPTATESAGSGAVDANYFLAGTSSATPYAAGGAALLRNWLVMAQGGVVDPGQIYAQLFLSGTNSGPAWPAKEGVGEIVLPTDGWGMFGKIELTEDFRECNIPIDIQWSDIKHLQAAIWWPEELVLQGTTPTDTHNDIDLHVIDFAGIERGSSQATDGVFERANVDVAVSDGVWHLKIDGKSFHRLPQVVYWTVALRRLP